MQHSTTVKFLITILVTVAIDVIIILVSSYFPGIYQFLSGVLALIIAGLLIASLD